MTMVMSKPETIDGHEVRLTAKLSNNALPEDIRRVQLYLDEALAKIARSRSSKETI